MKAVKKILKAILCLFLVLIVIIGAYVLYVVCQYSRIKDNKNLNIHSGKNSVAVNRDMFKIMTYNIGFGAYTQDFSFFMDEGTMNDGTKVAGKDSRAKDKQTVINNTNGAIATVAEENPDFVFMQEVDTKSHRARKVNQLNMITSALPDCTYSFAENFHSAYLFYPVTNPHGKSNSGILTYSKFDIFSSLRRSFPVDNGFPAKFFDYDRCFVVSRLNLDGVRNGKQLVLINVHLSAYDKGGKIRQKQLKMLNSVLKEERDKGNYVVCGGDFNHDIASAYAEEGKDSLTYFASEQKIPEWVYRLTDENLEEGFKFVASLNAPTCRSTDMPYKKGVNYSVVIDGFIVSDNIVVELCKNIDTDFKYSDHNPAMMIFSLA